MNFGARRRLAATEAGALESASLATRPSDIATAAEVTTLHRGASAARKEMMRIVIALTGSVGKKMLPYVVLEALIEGVIQ